ncbi:tetratricopeptide repeat protein [Massilia endophytica]|uniref:tetratricopeptide repeat protein n=1 Tax=Massilia endophytica TaxID=2899220 RepID=UPI001E4729BB|nr:tetratricopeptide repeat protein [Massilia endophytica]UGQ47497.1 tetratricopeptide repeat protein [Massilia endophytica]
MSQFRIARISLLLAALSAAPALMTVAHAQDKKADPKAAAAPVDSVRPEVFKLVNPAEIKPLMDAKNYGEVKTRLDTAAALPNLTVYEQFVLNRMRVALGSATNDTAMATAALEAVINSGKLQPNEQKDFIQALGNMYYNNKEYAKAITWFNRYTTETGDMKLRPFIIRAYYLSNDFATAKAESMKDLEAKQKAGQTPAIEELQILANTGSKTKDQATYLLALENLVRYYPNDDYWVDLLSRTRGKDNYSNRFALDVYRLQKVATTKMAAEEYQDMAELALLAGQPIEAKQVLDTGFANGSLGTGNQAAKHKALRAQADKQAADDTKNIGTGEASARKSKNGTGLVNLGYAYVTLGQYDKGIGLIQEGIAKGGLQNAEDAKLRLGYSYAMAGRKEDAIKTLQTVTGNDGRGDLARYWILWVNRPNGPVAAN